MNNAIFIDMDGVLSDFIGGVSRLLGLEPAQVLERWPRGEPHGYVAFGLQTEDNFWQVIDGKLGSKVEDFWASLEMCERAKDLYDLCSDRGPTFVLTSPSRNPASSSGKVRWLQRHFGQRFRSFILTQHKYLMAAPGRVLIDDWDQNVEKWEKAGGRSILVPRVWNQAHMDAHRSFSVVVEGIEKHCYAPFN